VVCWDLLLLFWTKQERQDPEQHGRNRQPHNDRSTPVVERLPDGGCPAVRGDVLGWHGTHSVPPLGALLLPSPHEGQNDEERGS